MHQLFTRVDRRDVVPAPVRLYPGWPLLFLHSEGKWLFGLGCCASPRQTLSDRFGISTPFGVAPLILLSQLPLSMADATSVDAE